MAIRGGEGAGDAEGVPRFEAGRVSSGRGNGRTLSGDAPRTSERGVSSGRGRPQPKAERASRLGAGRGLGAGEAAAEGSEFLGGWPGAGNELGAGGGSSRRRGGPRDSGRGRTRRYADARTRPLTPAPARGGLRAGRVAVNSAALPGSQGGERPGARAAADIAAASPEIGAESELGTGAGSGREFRRSRCWRRAEGPPRARTGLGTGRTRAGRPGTAQLTASALGPPGGRPSQVEGRGPERGVGNLLF